MFQSLSKICTLPEVPKLCDLHDKITDCRACILALNDIDQESTVNGMKAKIKQLRNSMGERLKDLLTQAKEELARLEKEKEK